MTCYERLRTLTEQYVTEPQEELSALQTLSCACGAKTFALVSTYPLQVLRTRQHRVGAKTGAKSKSGSPSAGLKDLVDLVRNISRHEGFGGFYKGLRTAAIREVPATGVTFLVYESIKLHLL